MEATVQREDPKREERGRAVIEVSLKKSILKSPRMQKRKNLRGR